MHNLPFNLLFMPIKQKNVEKNRRPTDTSRKQQTYDCGLLASHTKRCPGYLGNIRYQGCLQGQPTQLRVYHQLCCLVCNTPSTFRYTRARVPIPQGPNFISATPVFRKIHFCPYGCNIIISIF